MILIASSSSTIKQDIQLDLTKEQKLLRASLRQLGGLETHNEAAVCELAGAMRERLGEFSSAVDFYLVLGLIRRLNVRPKCGNNTFLVSPRSRVLMVKSL